MSKEEYLVHVWGGAWNKDANPSIEKDLGIKEGYHYFNTKQEKDDFLKLLDNPVYKKQGLVYTEQFGVMSHKRTVFVGTLKYKNKNFVIHRDFGYEFPEDVAEFMFVEGDNSCDCNRSLLIYYEYGENSIPLLKCGDEIELVDYHFEYED